MLDYATGRLWALLSNAKGTRRLKEIVLPVPLGAQEALGIVAHVCFFFINFSTLLHRITSTTGSIAFLVIATVLHSLTVI